MMPEEVVPAKEGTLLSERSAAAGIIDLQQTVGYSTTSCQAEFCWTVRSIVPG